MWIQMILDTFGFFLRDFSNFWSLFRGFQALLVSFVEYFQCFSAVFRQFEYILDCFRRVRRVLCYILYALTQRATVLISLAAQPTITEDSFHQFSTETPDFQFKQDRVKTKDRSKKSHGFQQFSTLVSQLQSRSHRIDQRCFLIRKALKSNPKARRGVWDSK